MFTILSEKRSICHDCQEGLTCSLNDVQNLGQGLEKLHFSFSRNSAKTPLWIYSGHLQGYSKETEFILELAMLCKFIIM